MYRLLRQHISVSISDYFINVFSKYYIYKIRLITFMNVMPSLTGITLIK